MRAYTLYGIWPTCDYILHERSLLERSRIAAIRDPISESGHEKENF